MFLTSGLIIAFTFSSCKKNHLCECRDKQGNVAFVFSFKDTEKNAEKSCVETDQSYEGSEFNCELR